MLKVYNTLGREYQEFKTIEKGKVRFYQCGPTVYSHQHIGNLLSAVKGDLVRRSLLYLGYEVSYTRNITDVGHLVSDGDEGEDKIEKGAKREDMTPKEIIAKYANYYKRDLEKLNVLEPTNETVATDYIDQMANMVQALLDKGYAYATNKAIYYNVSKFPTYTELSRQVLDSNITGAGYGSAVDPDKKTPFDFAIWFFKTGVHKNAIQTWKHKFAGIAQTTIEGFPGWHIECSAMSKDTLGDTLDIHMGGVEHIPIHHTNEIAQSEGANGVKYVNYWLHHEMLEIESSKMSKSLGNMFTLDDIIKRGFDPLVYRYFLLQAHYRSKQNFTWEGLQASKNAYERLVAGLRKYYEEDLEKGIDTKFKDKFIKNIENDFNSPKALAVVWEVIKSKLPNSKKLGTILDFDKVLGLKLEENIKAKETIEIPHSSYYLFLKIINT